MDTHGDALFVDFQSARDLLTAAVAAQRAIIAHTWPDGASPYQGRRAPLIVPIWYSYEPGGELRVVTARTSRKAQLNAPFWEPAPG